MSKTQILNIFIHFIIFQAEVWNIDIVTKESVSNVLTEDQGGSGLIRVDSHTQVWTLTVETLCPANFKG